MAQQRIRKQKRARKRDQDDACDEAKPTGRSRDVSRSAAEFLRRTA